MLKRQINNIMISVNKRAVAVLNEVKDKCDKLNVEYVKLGNGAHIFNFSEANFDGGIYLSRVCMGDLCQISQSVVKARIAAQSGSVDLEMLEVETQEPIIGCMAAQYAGWSIKVKKLNDEGKKKTYFKCMGSGPARSIALKEKKLFEEIKYKDTHNQGVLVLETSQMPDEGVAEYVAEKCGIEPKNVYLCYAPTACLSGSIQISARIVETSIHKFLELGINPEWIVSGTGNCPVAPVAKDDFKAMGWTNDCIIFAGNVTLNMDVDASEEGELKKLVEKCPSNTSPSYGKPFAQVFKDAGGDFYKIDPGMFAPAKITVINRLTGNVFEKGDLNPTALDFS
ncbi:MAG: methenyltetrahydromethanopterin cyclohydrolase [Candidatus Lokiarchaeota archaeon]|nr:methenyltetrahydromethanopterin cyclohydrolase [Candidatus Lokiarchaeota archaeon]